MAAGANVAIKLMSIVISIPVGIATKKVVERTWQAARPENPPRKPSEPGVQWRDAIGWAALSSAGVVAADLVTRRSAETAYHAITGNPPPPPKPSKQEKKAQKKAAKKQPATADT